MFHLSREFRQGLAENVVFDHLEREEGDRENTLRSSSKEGKGLVRNLSQMSRQSDGRKAWE